MDSAIPSFPMFLLVDNDFEIDNHEFLTVIAVAGIQSIALYTDAELVKRVADKFNRGIRIILNVGELRELLKELKNGPSHIAINLEPGVSRLPAESAESVIKRFGFTDLG